MNSRIALCLSMLLACDPVVGPSHSPVTSETQVQVSRIDDPDDPTTRPAETAHVGPSDAIAATRIDPAPTPSLGAPNFLLNSATATGALALQTRIAAMHSGALLVARARGGYVARFHGMSGDYGPIFALMSAIDDDAEFIAAGDSDAAWVAASSPTGGVRIVKIDDPSSAHPIVHAVENMPTRLGIVTSLVPFSAHIAVIGRSGTSITFAKIDRHTKIIDGFRTIATGALPADGSRTPRATNDEDRLLLAWDAMEIPEALDTPGTTAAERLAPNVGIFVRRFSSIGEPAGPTRRLTRPSTAARTLDVVVELGACAVLAKTKDGYDMFRFIRKGDDLTPYGGGLHLAPPGGDIALANDVVGTLAVTASKLIRIGPGVKIVPSAHNLAAVQNASNDEVKVATDGRQAYAVVSSKLASGMLPAVGRIDGEHMGSQMPAPWVGPTPQHMLVAGQDGDHVLVVLLDDQKLRGYELTLEGKVSTTIEIPDGVNALNALEWSRPPMPRAARTTDGTWVVAMRDSRFLIVGGPKSGAIVTPSLPRGAPVGGAIWPVPAESKNSTVALIYVPPVEIESVIWTATLDPKSASSTPFHQNADTERHYGVLGDVRFQAVARAGGGLYLATNSGPKVSSVAQSFGLFVVNESGIPHEQDIASPGSLADMTLAPTLAGPALISSIGGRGVGTTWLDAGAIHGWRINYGFNVFRVRGDGPTLRDGDKLFALAGGAVPVDLGPEVLKQAESCPFTFAAGPRRILFVCEEGSGDNPLAARVSTRSVSF